MTEVRAIQQKIKLIKFCNTTEYENNAEFLHTFYIIYQLKYDLHCLHYT